MVFVKTSFNTYCKSCHHAGSVSLRYKDVRLQCFSAYRRRKVWGSVPSNPVKCPPGGGMENGKKRWLAAVHCIISAQRHCYKHCLWQDTDKYIKHTQKCVRWDPLNPCTRAVIKLSHTLSGHPITHPVHPCPERGLCAVPDMTTGWLGPRNTLCLPLCSRNQLHMNSCFVYAKHML